MKINDTLRFVLPMLYDGTKGLNNDFFFNKYFIGVYTASIKNPEYDDKNILLVYKNDYTDEYAQFELQLFGAVNIDDILHIEEEDIIIYVVKLPKEYTYDYIMLNTGNYNLLSPQLKLNIYKMWNLQPADMLARILDGLVEYEGESFEDQTLNFN